MAQGPPGLKLEPGSNRHRVGVVVPGFFIAAHGQQILKERNALEIETVSKTTISLRWLLLFRCVGPSM